MLFYTGLFFLVIAVSLDGFGVGVIYGIRKIHVPFFALSIIILCSGTIVWLSMTIGNILSQFLTANIASMLGGLILIFIGLVTLLNIMKEQTANKNRFHLFKSMLKSPIKADLDQSGIISAGEAFLLGSALALDAFGAGLGASMLGYSPVITTLSIALMSGLFVFCGMKLGMLLSKCKQIEKLTFIPPLLLIALGIASML